MEQRSSRDKFKNTEFIEVGKANRKSFLFILKSYSRNRDWHVLSFLC